MVIDSKSLTLSEKLTYAAGGLFVIATLGVLEAQVLGRFTTLAPVEIFNALAILRLGIASTAGAAMFIGLLFSREAERLSTWITNH